MNLLVIGILCQVIQNITAILLVSYVMIQMKIVVEIVTSKIPIEKLLVDHLVNVNVNKDII